MEVETDLNSITDEDQLRKMWLDAEDFNRKKEIRTHLYKLREARLRGYYNSDDVDATSTKTTSRTKLTRDVCGGEMPPVSLSSITKNKFPFKSHGDSIIDHTYQSYKTKEIRDSESPTHEINCTSRGDHITSDSNKNNKLLQQHVADSKSSDKSGWNIQTSSEISPDGKLHKNELYATTEGFKQLDDGHSQFSGLNTEKSSIAFENENDKTIKRAENESKIKLHEKKVTGDVDNQRTETETTEVFSTSSKTFTTTNKPTTSLENLTFDHNIKSHNIEESLQEVNSSQETSQMKKSREILKLDKSAPEYQKYVDYLAHQNGQVLSETSEYVKPNVKLITTKKQLEDGTVVTTRRYETEEYETGRIDTNSSKRKETEKEIKMRKEQEKEKKDIKQPIKHHQDEKNFTYEKTVDSAHNAFASSLRNQSQTPSPTASRRSSTRSNISQSPPSKSSIRRRPSDDENNTYSRKNSTRSSFSDKREESSEIRKHSITKKTTTRRDESSTDGAVYSRTNSAKLRKLSKDDVKEKDIYKRKDSYPKSPVNKRYFGEDKERKNSGPRSPERKPSVLTRNVETTEVTTRFGRKPKDNIRRSPSPDAYRKPIEGSTKYVRSSPSPEPYKTPSENKISDGSITIKNVEESRTKTKSYKVPRDYPEGPDKYPRKYSEDKDDTCIEIRSGYPKDDSFSSKYEVRQSILNTKSKKYPEDTEESPVEFRPFPGNTKPSDYRRSSNTSTTTINIEESSSTEKTTKYVKSVDKESQEKEIESGSKKQESNSRKQSFTDNLRMFDSKDKSPEPISLNNIRKTSGPFSPDNITSKKSVETFIKEEQYKEQKDRKDTKRTGDISQDYSSQTTRQKPSYDAGSRKPSEDHTSPVRRPFKNNDSPVSRRKPSEDHTSQVRRPSKDNDSQVSRRKPSDDHTSPIRRPSKDNDSVTKQIPGEFPRRKPSADTSPDRRQIKDNDSPVSRRKPSKDLDAFNRRKSSSPDIPLVEAKKNLTERRDSIKRNQDDSRKSSVASTSPRRRSSLELDDEKTKPSRKLKSVLKRSETYEERCRLILGMDIEQPQENPDGSSNSKENKDIPANDEFIIDWNADKDDSPSKRKKIPITERKDSAPIHVTPKHSSSSSIYRSTSEHVISKLEKKKSQEIILESNRLPDVIQEPEDENVKNMKGKAIEIPILNEETNEYMKSFHIEEMDETDDIPDRVGNTPSPIISSPQYPPREGDDNNHKYIDEDNCLSVNEKLSKFLSLEKKNQLNVPGKVYKPHHNKKYWENDGEDEVVIIETSSFTPDKENVSSVKKQFENFDANRKVDEKINVNSNISRGIVSSRKDIFETSNSPVDSSILRERDNISDEGRSKVSQLRHSYMNHTISSMEHRRDSLELAKTSYGQKIKALEEPYEPKSSTAVKFVESPKTPPKPSTRKESRELLIPQPQDVLDSSKLEDISVRRSSVDIEEYIPTKFGVDLRRKNSQSKQRKSSNTESSNIEEIYDLDLLEDMLKNAAGYEQRRRIRAQIRIVKKKIEDRKASAVSPNRKLKSVTSTTTTTSKKMSSNDKSPEGFARTSTVTTIKKQTGDKGEEKTITSTTTKRLTDSDMKALTTKKRNEATSISTTKKTTSDGPIWVRQNILRKANTNDTPTRTFKTTKTEVGPSRTVKTTTTTKTTSGGGQQKHTEVDVITSSYGIGPTDDDGKPLFGIRALKYKKSSELPADSGTNKNDRSNCKSFINESSNELTGINDVIIRMQNADKVQENGDTEQDREARALLNKFIGANILMSSIEQTTGSLPSGPIKGNTNQINCSTRTTTGTTISGNNQRFTAAIDDDNKLLEDEEPLEVINFLKQIMAGREDGEQPIASKGDGVDSPKKEDAVKHETTSSSSSTNAAAKKPISPLNKFKQLEKQNSLQSPKSPISPQAVSCGGAGTPPQSPIFKFTDPALNARALTFKEQLLQWCQAKTKEYEVLFSFYVLMVFLLFCAQKKSWLWNLLLQ
ncbi:SMTN family protein [Megaselia abdita]